LRKCFFDTESIGFRGPTVLIQYAFDDGEIVLHDIWNERVIDTLNLIEEMMGSYLIGFNLTHDMFHLARTYGVLSMLPKLEPPNVFDYRDCEEEDESRDAFCLKPKKALDLMLHGRKGEFQSTLNQKDINIRRVPIQLANVLIKELSENVELPDIYFAKSKSGYKWKIVDLDEDGVPVGDRDVPRHKELCNLKLSFNPSTALKAIIENVLKREVVTLDDLPKLPSPDEKGHFPAHGGWLDVFHAHRNAWRDDDRRLKYARDDVVYTRDLFKYFGSPDGGDVDSSLACAVGVSYWRGFRVRTDVAKEVLEVAKDKVARAGCNVNAPRQVRQFLLECCDEFEALAIPDTKNETLKNLLNPEWEESNPKLYERVQRVVDGRRADRERDLCEKLIDAGRLYASFKVIGTKSNRMSGGSEGYVSRGGSINPQGIKKGSLIRSIFDLAAPDEQLDGGDFSGHEVAIAEARFKDENLRQFLLSGKKFHGLFGSVMYGMTYEEIMATEELNRNDTNGFYQRAKTGVFAWFYGAHYEKLAEALWLDVEIVEERILTLEDKFPGIKKAREEIYENFAALRQPAGIGTKVEWHEPAQFVESFLGFKRYFAMEFAVIKILFEMAQNPSDELRAASKGLKVKRRDRLQTGSGAVASALYAAAFNVQAQVMRAAANHHIQSPGGETTKVMQANIWDLQPSGVSSWKVMCLNVHDELMTVCDPSYSDKVKEVVYKTVEYFRSAIPLIKMEWKQELKSWAEK